MARSFFILAYRLDGFVSHLIWFTNDTDGVVTDEGGSIVAFRDLCELKGYASTLGLILRAAEPGSGPIDFDEVERWLAAPTKVGIECELFLNSWNLFDDVARSIRSPEFVRLSEEGSVAYDKLFWGSNIPAVTPPGERFDPVWSDQEVEGLRQVLGEGMAMFRRGLGEIG